MEHSTAYFLGSFNPYHLGHTLLVQTAIAQLGLQQVVIIPTGQPPHKQGLLPIKHRLAMAQLSCQGLAGVRVSDAEASPPPEGTNAHFTAATLQRLLGPSPNQPIPLLLGEDAYLSLPTWQQAAWLQAHTLAIVAPRVGSEVPNPLALTALPHWPTVWLAMPLVGVSATWVRQRLQAGQAVHPWLHEEAYQYWQAHHLADFA